MKSKTKLWITTVIHKSILVKNSLFRKNIKLKNPVKKIKAQDDKYKHFKNLLSTVKKYYNEFFKSNVNNIKSNWKGTKNLLTWNKSVSSKTQLLSQGNETVTNLTNIFKMITSVQQQKKTKTKIKFLSKLFDEFLQYDNEHKPLLKKS